MLVRSSRKFQNVHTVSWKPRVYFNRYPSDKLLLKKCSYLESDDLIKAPFTKWTSFVENKYIALWKETALHQNCEVSNANGPFFYFYFKEE